MTLPIRATRTSSKYPPEQADDHNRLRPDHPPTSPRSLPGSDSFSVTLLLPPSHVPLPQVGGYQIFVRLVVHAM